MQSIKTSADFKRVAHEGEKWVSSSFVLRILKRNDTEPFRLGLIVTKKLGNAVVRNRTKRRFREVMRSHAPQERLQGYDLVLIGRASSVERDFEDMVKDLLWCLKRLGV